jgi:hypothetical protein
MRRRGPPVGETWRKAAWAREPGPPQMATPQRGDEGPDPQPAEVPIRVSAAYDRVSDGIRPILNAPHCPPERGFDDGPISPTAQTRASEP